MKNVTIFFFFLFVLTACSDHTPVITKEEANVEDLKDSSPELIEQSDTNNSNEDTPILVEFNLPTEKVTINLDKVGILNAYLKGVENRKQELKQMNLEKLDANNFEDLYLLQFSCHNNACSYLLLDQRDEGRSKLIADLAKFNQALPSPDGEKIAFSFSRELNNHSLVKNKIIILDISNWKTLKNESVPDMKLSEFFSGFTWPIEEIHWKNNQVISLTVPDIEKPSELETWLESEKKYKDIEITIQN